MNWRILRKNHEFEWVQVVGRNSPPPRTLRGWVNRINRQSYVYVGFSREGFIVDGHVISREYAAELEFALESLLVDWGDYQKRTLQ